MKVRLRAAAVEDIDSIFEYSVERYGIETADAYLHAIDAALERLAGYPEIGMQRLDLDAGLRCLLCREHGIYYEIVGDRVSVWRVLHKAMDAKRWLS